MRVGTKLVDTIHEKPVSARRAGHQAGTISARNHLRATSWHPAGTRVPGILCVPQGRAPVWYTKCLKTCVGQKGGAPGWYNRCQDAYGDLIGIELHEAIKDDWCIDDDAVFLFFDPETGEELLSRHPKNKETHERVQK